MSSSSIVGGRAASLIRKPGTSEASQKRGGRASATRVDIDLMSRDGQLEATAPRGVSLGSPPGSAQIELRYARQRPELTGHVQSLFCSCGNPLAGREMPCPCSAAGVTGPRVARIALHLRYCYSRPWGCSWRGCPGRASCSSGSLAGLITHDGALCFPISVLICPCPAHAAGNTAPLRRSRAELAYSAATLPGS